MPEFEAVAGKARNDVNVGMENDLPGRWLVVHVYVYSVRREDFQGVAYFFCRFHHLGQHFGGGFVNVLEMLFGDDQSVADVYRLDIQEGENFLILVDFRSWDITLYNFAKHAVFHVE